MKYLLVTAAVAFTATLAVAPRSVLAGGSSEPLCSLPPITYVDAKVAHPESAFALSELESRGIATWYSDREENGDYVATAQQLVAHCPSSSRLSVVVYGLPNKDCEAGYSTIGSRVHSAYDYEQFVSTLAGIVGQRKVLYVLEPDAVGLLAKSGGSGSGCAARSGYKENLQTAIRILTSGNLNADVYLDVGYWTLSSSESVWSVADIVRELGYAGRVKGITLNTSNYRSNSELADLCGNFQRAVGYNGMNCVIDTSRNYHGSSSSEWCNLKSAGIGKAPTSNTGFPSIDYFVWIKPPGDSDGTCNDGTHTWEAMQGPGAGVFFQESFKLLWNQGSLVQELNLPPIDGTIRSVPTSAPATPAPTTATPVPIPAPAPTPEPTADLSALQAAILAQMLAEAEQARKNQTLSRSADGSGSSSSSSSGNDVGDNSSSLSTVTVGEEANDSPSNATPVPTPSSSPSPDESVNGISTSADGTSTGTKVGVITVLFLAGIATSVGVVLFLRTQRNSLQQNKPQWSPSVPPLTPA